MAVAVGISKIELKPKLFRRTTNVISAYNGISKIELKPISCHC